MIVHSLISLIAPNLVQITDGIAAGILLIVAILGLVAIAIDRRALLVSALAYIGIVIVYAGAMWTGQKGPPQVDILFYSTLCILGAFVIALGVGWQPLRRGLLALISPSIARKLPPVPKIT